MSEQGMHKLPAGWRVEWRYAIQSPDPHDGFNPLPSLAGLLKGDGNLTTSYWANLEGASNGYAKVHPIGEVQVAKGDIGDVIEALADGVKSTGREPFAVQFWIGPPGSTSQASASGVYSRER